MNRKQLNSIVFKYRWVLLLTAITGLSQACQKEEGNSPPLIRLIKETGYIHSDTNIAPGNEFRVKVLMQKSDLNLTNFLIDVYTDTVSHYLDTGMNTAYVMWEGLFIKTLAPIEDWRFTIRDRLGNASYTSISIGIDTSGAYQPLIEYSPINLGAQENPQKEACYDISDSSSYFYMDAAGDADIQSGIDLIYYYYGIEDFNTIASPGANIEDGIFDISIADWSIRNTSRFLKTVIDPDEFMEACNDSIIIANYNEGEAKRKAKNLAPDDIYTFRTQSGRLGMFLVMEVNGTTAGDIVIQIKTQP